MIKTLIADDHTMFADGISSILALEKDIEVVGKTATAIGVFEIIHQKDVHFCWLNSHSNKKRFNNIIEFIPRNFRWLNSNTTISFSH